MKESVTLKSGAELQLQMATFALSMRLLKSVVNELKAVKLDIMLNGQLDLKKLQQMDLPIDMLKNACCQMLGSDAVETAVMDCAKVCLYAGEKITRDSFEKEEARQDYLPCAWEVMKMNLAPFFKGLDLKSLTASPPPDAGPT